MRRIPVILLLVSQLTSFTLAQQPGNPQPDKPDVKKNRQTLDFGHWTLDF